MSSILFICDASPLKGFGHLRRVTAIAESCSDRKSECYLLCFGDIHFRPDVFKEIKVIETEEDERQEIKEIIYRNSIAKMLVDHYRVDRQYQEFLLSLRIPWMQFDYKCRGFYYADWIVNLNPAAHLNDYLNIVSPNTKLLLGTDYCILRKEFSEITDEKKVEENLKRVLLIFGAGDDRGLNEKFYTWLKSSKVLVTVITTSKNPSKERLKQLETVNDNLNLVLDSNSVAAVMSKNDLAVTTGGTGSLELACLGIPFLTVQTHENQVRLSAALEKKGCSIDLGLIEDLNESTFLSVLKRMQDKNLRNKMSKSSAELVDCNGAERLAEILS